LVTLISYKIELSVIKKNTANRPVLDWRRLQYRYDTIINYKIAASLDEDAHTEYRPWTFFGLFICVLPYILVFK